jgi:hypothetical protein
MLQLRQDQMLALEKAAEERYIAQTICRLSDDLGNIEQVFGQAEVELAVRQGLRSARDQGFSSSRDCYIYISLTFSIMGHAYAEDPHPWAANILGDHFYPPNERILQLRDRARLFLSDIALQEPSYFRQVYRVAHHNRFSSLDESMTEPQHRLFLRSTLQNWFPGAVGVIGVENVDRLLEISLRRARDYGLISPRHASIVGVFAFLFGIYFDRDPRLTSDESVIENMRMTADEKVATILTRAQALVARKLAFET